VQGVIVWDEQERVVYTLQEVDAETEVDVGNLGLLGNAVVENIRLLVPELASLPDDERIEALNQIRLLLHDISPFNNEPVDCVLWVKAETVEANDYNPNKVAPPEMKLLEVSIAEDGYTQPIVTWVSNGLREVVDGFHRTRVGKESAAVRKRIRGYLPVTTVNDDRIDRGDRIATTIRHNRARGKHQVQAMSEIVVELSRRFWTEEKIAKELGMDPDEVLRLKQISGLAEMFLDREFSEAWEIDS
jgi:ParB-like chromosome segregation protein Spo0J